MMKALITGASSGIGKEMAIYLSELGYDLILIARNSDRLMEIKKELKTDVKICKYDLSLLDNVYKLCKDVKNEHIDIVVNNAGFGLFGDYNNSDTDIEMNMIDLNVKCLHVLTKYFIKDKNVKYILNVGSSAGLMRGGPLMSTYYATKSYVVNFTLALYEELRRNKSDKVISVLCPGPVDTNFNNRAHVEFNLNSLDARYVARYAIDKLFKKKLIIIPGLGVKMGIFATRILPIRTLLKITYKIQERKKTP